MCVRIRFCIEALWESEKQRPCKVLERPGNSDLGAQMYEKLNAASKRWRPLFRPLVLIACAKCNLVGSERVITLPSISKTAVHRDLQSCEEFLRQTRDWMQTLTIEDLLEGGKLASAAAAAYRFSEKSSGTALSFSSSNVDLQSEACCAFVCTPGLFQVVGVSSA